MDKKIISLSEGLYILAFFIFLLGSSLTLIEHGVELSLWLMAFAVLINMITTLFPWLGVQWLKAAQKGSRMGWWLAIALQIVSWITFGVAMILRLKRSLPGFYTWITVTLLLWAAWLLISIYSRHACPHGQQSDKLNPSQK
jgi:Na+/proline symporter